MITRDFDLWITQGHTKRLVFNANQYDQGETWRFRILGADGNPIVPTTAAIIGQKKDGHAILVQGTVSDGKVVITETEQMTACAGLTEFELLLNGETHGTANFTVQVEKRPGDDADLSDSDLSLIQDAVDAAEVIVEVIGDGDPSEVIGEHVDAWLDNHPEATTTVEDGAITAPKINQSLWDKLLVSEEASGNPASFDDGADDVPVSSLKVALEPIQFGSGDPSPSNVRPIYPANGKNLFDIENANILNAYINGSNKITGSAVDRMVYIPILANQQFSVTYTQKALATASQSDDMQIGLFDSIPVAGLTGVRIYNATRSAPTVDMKVSYTGNSSSHTWLAMKIGNIDRTDIQASMATLQIEYGNVTSYQPYQGIMVERCGKNLLNMNIASGTYSGLTITANDDGSILVNGTPTADLSFTKATGAYAPMLHKGVTYTVKGTRLPVSNCFLQLIYNGVESGTTYSLVNNNGNDYTITMTEDATFNNVYFTFKNGQTFTNWSFCPQLVVGTDTSENIPYIGTSYPYTLGQSVYGGSVDLATGVLTVTHGIVDMGTLTWVYDSTRTCFYTVLAGMKTFAPGDLATYVCDSYQTIAPAYAAGNEQNNTIWARVNETTFRVRDTSYTVAADFKAAVSGHQLVYELATPQTYQLTPTQIKTLLGYNNISSSGTVDVIYHADTKLYVDKMTAVDNNIIAPTEADFVATRSYTVNDLLIVNDTLYKVTANIASGSAITPNSNVTQTTLSALIKALS